MEKIFKYGMALLSAVVLVFSFTACDSSNPVDKYIDFISEISGEMKDAKSMDDIGKIESKFSKGVETNSNYKLTAADKEKLEDAVIDFYYICIEKGVEIGGGDLTDPDIETYVEYVMSEEKKQIKAILVQSKTLGDFDAKIGNLN